jgi:colicin import membrane protein
MVVGDGTQTKAEFRQTNAARKANAIAKRRLATEAKAQIRRTMIEENAYMDATGVEVAKVARKARAKAERLAETEAKAARMVESTANANAEAKAVAETKARRKAKARRRGKAKAERRVQAEKEAKEDARQKEFDDELDRQDDARQQRAEDDVAQLGTVVEYEERHQFNRLGKKEKNDLQYHCFSRS